ncbi:MAG: hypothetical protein GY711_05915 [bacterium]|nr:hypothetical protein [bacterium]
MRTFSLLRCSGLATLLLLGTAIRPVAPDRSADIPFAAMAKEMLDAQGLGDADPYTFEIEEFFRRGFLIAPIGLFDVHMTVAAASNKADAASYQKMILTLLDVQSTWLEWLAPSGVDLSEPRADLDRLRKWAKGIRGGQIAKVAEAGGKDLFEGLGADEQDALAARRFAEFMSMATALGLERGDVREPIVLAPTREDFMRLVSFAGWARPELQGKLWQTEVKDWTVFYVEDYKVVALELAAAGRAKTDWKKGVSLNARVPNGMEQQVAQHAANSLVDSYFGASIPPSLAGGLAVNLVIDVFGECNTRVDGDLRERRTEAIEMFVPGGMSEGGVLPKNSAESRWRKEQGAKRFVGVLKSAQRKGASKAKRVKGKIQHFEIQNDDKDERMVVSGPYLGAAAAGGQGPPAEFQGDHAEFLRAYRTCFVHWLRTSTDGDEEAARQKFAAFLGALAAAESARDLEAVFDASFAGAKLSTAELGEDDLEGAFLRWLKKQ